MTEPAEKPLSEIVRRHMQAYFRCHEGSLPPPGAYDRLLPLFEKPLIETALDATGGNQSEAARRLGVSRVTLIDKMKKYGLGQKRP